MATIKQCDVCLSTETHGMVRSVRLPVPYPSGVEGLLRDCDLCNDCAKSLDNAVEEAQKKWIKEHHRTGIGPHGLVKEKSNG